VIIKKSRQGSSEHNLDIYGLSLANRITARTGCGPQINDAQARIRSKRVHEGIYYFVAMDIAPMPFQFNYLKYH